MTVVTRLNGGLGNQLFQVAMGLAVAKAADAELFLDDKGLTNSSIRKRATSRQLEVANLGWKLWPPEVNIERTPWWLPIARSEGRSAALTALGALVNVAPSLRSSSSTYVKEHAVTLDLPSLVDDLATRNFVYLSGYWADKTIPDLVRNEMIEALLPLHPASLPMIELRNAVEGSKSVAVHVRRGDFFSDIAPSHGVLEPDFFFQGIEMLYEGGDELFFFSDDPQWCRETFGDFSSARFVEPENSDKPLDHLLLMSKAKKFVLSNSSFSWWSAWLSGVDGRNIIRPKLWVANDSSKADKIYPSTWGTLGSRQ